nr:ROK family protein [Pseudoalteromonas luteoviolacea]
MTQIVTLGPISRADIARNTLLTKQTITNMVEALLAVSLVEEIGVKRTESAGKPSKMLCLNKHAAFTCAIRVSPNLLELGLYYLNGECHSKTAKDLVTQPNAQDIKQELEKFIATSGISFEAIFAGGLSIQTDQTDAVSQHQVNQHLQSQLSELLNLPIALENTASACAAYQMLFGEAKTLHNFVYLHLGNKVEAAVVYDRLIMLGQNGLTGAIGDIFVTPDQDEGTAELGTLNKYASINALKTFLDGCDEDTIPIEQLDPLSHPMCKKWITQAAEPLRIAIHTLESLLNTQTIIIGSDISEACLDALISSLRPFIPSIAQLGKRDIVRLIKVPNIDSIALTGIATLPLHAALNNKNMQTLYIPPFWSGNTLQSTVFSQ